MKLEVLYNGNKYPMKLSLEEHIENHEKNNVLVIGCINCLTELRKLKYEV
jgi:hypothetical protein